MLHCLKQLGVWSVHIDTAGALNSGHGARDFYGWTGHFQGHKGS